MKNIFKTVLLALVCAGALKTNAQVPIYNSLPSASSVILLDFDGHTVANTSWNLSGPFTVAGSGLDNAQITNVFNRIAEDFRPFNVNVTTEEAKYNAAPVFSRQRLLLTTSYEWYGISGGVAFLGSFTWGDNTPAFVFTSLHSYNIKHISEAGSHEVGHTLGLFHQAVYNETCGFVSEYNYGQGTGEIGWAPIMGVGYYQNFTLWNNGPSSNGCGEIQSDLTVITTENGFGYRNDDHGNSFGTATTATFIANQFTVNGIVERNTDNDYFRFTQPGVGRLQLNAIPYNVGTGNSGSDLDLQVTLYNSAQTQLSVYNPGNLLNSIVDTVLNPGTYYVKIEGRGNIYAPNYASLGSYSIQGSFSVGNPLPLRRLELAGELYQDKHRFNWIIDADEQVVEQILEISHDGVSFRPIGTPANEARTFMYRPYASGTLQYRLNVTFDNGRQYYSNIVTLRQTGGTPRPQLVGNFIANGQVIVTSPGLYDYLIYDMNGKAVLKGRLSTGVNNINTSGIVNGIYVIRFVNGNETWSEKFIRQ